MSRLSVITVSILFLFASYTFAGQSGNYAGISTGISVASTSTVTDRNGSEADLNFDLGIPVSISVGRQFVSGVRIDAELFYKYAALKDLKFAEQTVKPDGEIQAFGAMGNVYYTFFNGFADAPYLPYLGAGIGLADIEMSQGSDDRFTYWSDDNDTVFSYQGIIGFNAPIRPDILLDVSYRYFGASNIRIDQTETDMNTHNIVLGVRYFW
jgi:opacity protein-like surface antigen